MAPTDIPGVAVADYRVFIDPTKRQSTLADIKRAGAVQKVIANHPCVGGVFFLHGPLAKGKRSIGTSLHRHECLARNIEIALLIFEVGMFSGHGSTSGRLNYGSQGMHVVLVHPEIAPNTGNIIRLCANAGAELHLVEPLGFTLDDRLLKRGGLDYHELASLTVHQDFESVRASLSGPIYTFSSSSQRRFDQIDFSTDSVFVFGAERNGLPGEVIDQVPNDHRLQIPMRAGNRSLNLANAVSIVVYEAWRQHDFSGAAPAGATTSETPGAPTFDS